ncbi:hypothetical protein V6Z11_A12G270000 [Gossypium hirsutum]
MTATARYSQLLNGGGFSFFDRTTKVKHCFCS